MSRLVIFARKLDQGGAERQIVALAKELKKKGWDVHVLLFYIGGVFDSELAAAGVPMHFVDKRGRWDVFGFVIRLISILHKLRPATIYSFLDLPNILSVVLGPFIGSPRLVWSIRAAGMEMRHYDWLSRLIPWLEAFLSRAANIVVANSHAGKSWAAARGFPSDKIVVVENGIDTARFQFDTLGRARLRAEWEVVADETVIGLVGRLDPMKGHEFFLETAAQLVKTRKHLKFVCVGSGNEQYAHRLKQHADALGLKQQVIWAGPRSDMAAVFSALDILASSSCFGEGFSNVIAEAMSCERPCVVTDVGDSARIVGELGEVVPPRNPDAFVAALATMLDRIHENTDLGSQARARIVGQFSVERMVLRTESILDGHS